MEKTDDEKSKLRNTKIPAMSSSMPNIRDICISCEYIQRDEAKM